MREPDERTTIIKTDGSGAGAGMIAGVLIAIAAVALVIYLFVDIGGVDNSPTAAVETPDATPNVTIESPDIDVTAPQAPSGSEDASQTPANTAPATE